MSRPTLSIEVTPSDQRILRSLLKGGIQPVRVVLRAVALLQLAHGVTASEISGIVPLTPQAIRKIGHRYLEVGLEGALFERSRPGAAELLTDQEKQRILEMVKGAPPEGRSRWTVRLVTEQVVKRQLAPRVGRETIRTLLEKKESKSKSQGSSG